MRRRGLELDLIERGNDLQHRRPRGRVLCPACANEIGQSSGHISSNLNALAAVHGRCDDVIVRLAVGHLSS